MTNPTITMLLRGSGNGIVPPAIPSVAFDPTVSLVPPVPITILPSCTYAGPTVAVHGAVPDGHGAVMISTLSGLTVLAEMYVC